MSLLDNVAETIAKKKKKKIAAHTGHVLKLAIVL